MLHSERENYLGHDGIFDCKRVKRGAVESGERREDHKTIPEKLEKKK